MRIAINTLPLLRNKAGAEQYTINIIKELAKLDKENEYIIVCSKINKDIYVINQNNFSQFIADFNACSRIKRILYEQIILPFVLKKLKVDVLFSPCNITSVFAFCKKVTMIFDMHWFLCAKKLSGLRVFYIKNFIKLSAIFSDKILTLSESSLKDILKFTSISRDKISITPVGHTPLCALKENLNFNDWDNIKGKYNLNNRYLLFIGQLLFRKNVESIIKALDLIKKENSKLDFKFVIIGGYSEAYSVLKDMAVNLELGLDIQFLGQLDDNETAHILNNAEAFIYPSLYEGFGIPVLEAMYYDIPVITSKISSLPEVGGEACLYVDPRDVNGIKKAVLRLFSDKTFSNELVVKGQKQAQKFTWNRTAEITATALTFKN